MGEGTSKTPNSSFLHARRSGSIPPLPPAPASPSLNACHADARGSHGDAQVLEVTQTLLHYIPKPISEPAEEEMTVSSCRGSEEPQIRNIIGRERHCALRGTQTSNVDLLMAAQGHYMSKRVCVCVCVRARSCVQELIDIQAMCVWAGAADLSNGRVTVLEHQAASRYWTSAYISLALQWIQEKGSRIRSGSEEKHHDVALL